MICGASYQDLPAVRNLALAYALAGADCIDMAADPAVVSAAKEGLAIAKRLAESADGQWQRPGYRSPLVMVSMSAGEDPHFRKAWFDANICPTDCSRPCEKICPAAAIAFEPKESGVISDRCYGCGRCLPVCPYGLIEAKSQPTSLDAIAQEVLTQADALEIHTHVGQQHAFANLWRAIKPWTEHLQLISISCPDGENLISYLKELQQIIGADPNSASENSDTKTILIWQTDGRPMSGDIGRGTTHAAIRLAQKVLAAELSGYVQPAGGTNQYTVTKLRALGLLPSLDTNLVATHTVSGIAYGSFARRLLMSVLEQNHYLEEVPHALQTAVTLAESLVTPLKQVAIGRSQAQ
ncbi:4Fe-4S binding domain protein [Synechococcus sp. PCC 7335]|nr:4Fe-4S binding domain protein [Synechococcus sp. PCC 7335]